jgi:uncharacterized membrane protein YbhN (UPF0104 family)
MTKAAKKNSWKIFKKVFELVFFGALTALAIWYVFHSSTDPKTTMQTIGKIRLFPFLVCILAALGLNLIDGIALTLFARIFDHRYQYHQGVLVATIGSFIGVYNKVASNVVEATTFSKQGIDSAHSASIVTMNFLNYQGVLAFYSLVTFILGYKYIVSIPLQLFNGMPVVFFCIIGLVINIFMFAIFCMIGYSDWLHKFLLTTGIRVMSKLHLVHNPEEARKKWAVKIATYHIEMRRMLKHPWTCLISFFSQILKQVLKNSIPFIVIWALSPKEFIGVMPNYWSLFCGSNFLSLIAIYLSAGAPEVAFQSIFSYLLNAQGVLSFCGEAGCLDAANLLTSSANIVWRFLTFYFTFAIGAVCFLVFRGNKKKENGEAMDLDETMTNLELASIQKSARVDDNTRSFVRVLDSEVQKGPHPTGNLLSEEDVSLSFKSLSKNIQGNLKEKPDKSDGDISGFEQKILLANVLKETTKLSEKKRSEEEIKKAAEEALLNSEQDEKRRVKRLAIRKAQRKAKQEEKEKIEAGKKLMRDEKKLQKLEPEGTAIHFDSRKGLIIDSPEVEEQKTKTTSETTEVRRKKEKEQNGTEEKRKED